MGKKKTAFSKKMAKEVRKISKETTLRLAETKVVSRLTENNQLYHNSTIIHGPYLQTIKKGLNDPTLGSNANARVGDEIILKEFQQRLWLSNKNDRPNVMYRITTFWFPQTALVATVPVPSDVYFFAPTLANQPNTMILRPNTETIKVISDKFIFSENNYAVPTQTQPYPVIAGPGIWGRERSQIRTINSRYKARKVKYLDSGVDGIGAGGPVKSHDIFVAITAYDAWGTVTSDNIASYASNVSIKFKDL